MFGIFAVCATTACSGQSDGSEGESEGQIVAHPMPPMCGGIGGIQCPPGLECELDGHYPNASGRCVTPVPAWDKCTTDRDVIAVDRVGCCPNGEQEAVNKDHVAEYRATFAGTVCGMVCPEYFMLDTRQPECINGRAEMVDIERISCGGHTPNPHSCPEGYSCKGAGLPVDAPGKCEKDDAPVTCGDHVCGAGSSCQFCWGHVACVPNGAKC